MRPLTCARFMPRALLHLHAHGLLHCCLPPDPNCERPKAPLLCLGPHLAHTTGILWASRLRRRCSDPSHMCTWLVLCWPWLSFHPCASLAPRRSSLPPLPCLGKELPHVTGALRGPQHHSGCAAGADAPLSLPICTCPHAFGLACSLPSALTRTQQWGISVSLPSKLLLLLP